MNSSKNIRKSLESLYSQDFKNFEHIIQDGKSKDETIQIIKSFQDERTKFKSEKDKGLYYALNKAIKRSTGEYLILLHSDDILFDKYTLKKVFNFIKKNNSPKIVLTGVQYISNDGKVLRKWLPSLPSRRKINTGWMAPHTGIILKRNVINKMRFYDTRFKIAADYDYEISLFNLFMDDSLNSNFFLTKMLIGGVSNSGFKSKINKTFEDIEVMKKNGINPFIGIILKNARKIPQIFNFDFSNIKNKFIKKRINFNIK